jgi:lipid II:glycine glycyltransferase (peptidoglycan interpeptide bridge formation enzyme)
MPGCIVTCGEAQIDPAWDSLVAAVTGGDLTQTTAWATTRQRIGRRVCHLRLSASDGTLLAGCLMQFRRLLPGIWIGVIPRGPLIFREEPGVAERMLREVLASARRLGIRLLIVQPPEGSTTLPEAMAALGFRHGSPDIAPAATIRIDLCRSEEEILRSAHASRRRRIREALRSGLECRSSDDVERFYRLYLTTTERQGFAPLDLDELKAQWEILAPRGMCRIFIAKEGDVPLAGDWVTVFAGVVTSKLKGFDEARTSHAARSATTASIWTCILQLRQEGARSFDFGGFDRKIAEDILAGREPPPDFPRSTSFFKWTFGGEITLLPQSQFIFTDPLSRLALAGITQRLLASKAAKRLTQRVRAAR